MTTNNDKVDALVSPTASLNVLSQHEVIMLRDAHDGGLKDLFRRCSLAVLNCDKETDDTLQLLADYADFDVVVVQQDRGVRLEVVKAPGSAFVDGKMILGVREHLFSVLRDILYVNSQLESHGLDLNTSDGLTNFVFHILRNTGVLQRSKLCDIIVCWGGHSINRVEYDYTKEVGYQLGLRELHICTGCGPGAMKGPMKGAAIGHLKQRMQDGRYIGLTEPGIIASESPNPVVNELIIMPDIEKRLEAFVRLGHGVVVFPGGAGTAEEILFLLGVLLHPDNASVPFPFVLTGPKESADYFKQIDEFVTSILGEQVRAFYQVIIDDPEQVAAVMAKGVEDVFEFRRKHSDAYYYNWRLRIGDDFQVPFEPTHENMAALELRENMDNYTLACNLRRVFSGIVAGNVKESGIRHVQERGPFKLKGDKSIMDRMDKLLEAFVDQQRMKLPGQTYVPCYALEK